LFHAYKADRIVAEGNQGGEMVLHTLRTQWPQAPVRIVHASRAKVARAEPVAALYEQMRVRHAPGLDVLEDQMVTWEPLSGMPSPDRVDALVWAMTDLIVERPGRHGERAPEHAGNRLPRLPDYRPAETHDDWKVV
jgi:phage terminase large subunit-like protein